MKKLLAVLLGLVLTATPVMGDTGYVWYPPEDYDTDYTNSQLACVQALLDYNDMMIDLYDFAVNYIPLIEFININDVLYGDHPADGFYGDPLEDGMGGQTGMYSYMVNKALFSYGLDHDCSYEVHRYNYPNFNDLVAETLDKDIPVAVWLADPDSYQTKWTHIETGDPITWYESTDTVILLEATSTNCTFWHPESNQYETLSKSDFLKQYETLQFQALTITKKTDR